MVSGTPSAVRRVETGLSGVRGVNVATLFFKQSESR
jgi:hypothetical protein